MNPIVEFITKYTDKTLTEVSLPTLAYPKVYSAFSGMSQLSYVSLPRLKSMAAYMFSGCTNLTSVYMPEVTSVSPGAFMRCLRLESAVFPCASNIAQSAFNGCAQLSFVSFPAVTALYVSSIFYSCGLLQLELPMLSQYSVNGTLAMYCPSLSEMRFPAMTRVGWVTSSTTLAMYCDALTHIYLPNCSAIIGGVRCCINLDFSGMDAPNALKMSDMWFGLMDSSATYSALTEIVHSKVQDLRFTIGGHVPNLSRIYLPEVSHLSLSHNGYGSSTSPNLTEIYLPKLRYIDGSMFPYAPVTSLTIPWSQIEVIRASIVTSSAPCVSTITELSLPACTFLGQAPLGSYNAYLVSLYCEASKINATFNNYLALRNVTCPNASSVVAQMFTNCPNLESVSFPKATQLIANAFTITSSSYYSVSTPELHLSFPMCSVVGTNAFTSNNKLRELHLSICSQISGNSTFYHCSNFMSLYLYSTAVVTLEYAASSIFAGSPMRQSVNGVYGSIFVPASLITNYQTDTWWSWVKDRFVALPE